MPEMQQAMQILSAPANRKLLRQIQRGIEKESLRVTGQGQLSQSKHPEKLGSALTHSRITTDFSEALLEFITPPSSDIDETLELLEDIHRFTYLHLDEELLWVNSMPCALGDDTSIPIARYGSSNIARMKETYRTGLGNRYGRLMQTIAGIHYNWSIPDGIFSLLHRGSGFNGNFQDFKTRRYFALIRNFRRHTWLLLYLFGAAPAVCKSFVKNRTHTLQALGEDSHTLHTPYATSLRMGDLGYQSAAQESLQICYNSLDSYTKSLQEGLARNYPAYEAIGLQDEHKQYRQLNTHLLQIENEFYSTIRPKRTTNSGKTPLRALRERGVEYIEVRCIDLDPFNPIGISREQADFLDIFLLHCLLSESPDCNEQEYFEILSNQKNTVYEGRSPQLTLLRKGEILSREQWGSQIFSEMAPLADILDRSYNCHCYSEVLSTMARRLENSDLTPSARIIKELQETPISYFQWALKKSQEHKAKLLEKPLSDRKQAMYQEMALHSLEDQSALEASDNISFEDYLSHYFSQN